MNAEEKLAQMNLEQRKRCPHIVLRDTVCHNLEEGRRGSKFPVLASYLIDLEPDKISAIKEELTKIRDTWGGLSMVVFGPEGTLVELDTVEVVVPTHHDNYSGIPPHATATLDSKTATMDYLDVLLEACDDAIKRKVGFGQYSR